MKKTYNAYLLAAALVIISMPQAFSQQSLSAKEQFKLYESQVDTTIKQTQECLKSNPLPYAPEIVENVLYIYDDNPNKLNLLSSSLKINDEQKRQLTEYLTAANKCRHPALNNLASYPKIIGVIKTFNNEMDVIYANLLAKKITIGQANQSLLTINDGFDTKLDVAMNATAKAFNEQIKIEEIQLVKEEANKQLKAEKAKQDKLAQEAKEAQKNLEIIQKAEKAKAAAEAKEAQKNLEIVQKAEKAAKEKQGQQSASSKQSAQALQAQQEQERQYQLQLEQNRIQREQLAQQAQQAFNQSVNTCTQAAQQYTPPRSTPMPQGQMVGGYYVAPSWSQNLGAMLGNSPGGYTTNQALFESCMKARGY